MPAEDDLSSSSSAAGFPRSGTRATPHFVPNCVRNIYFGLGWRVLVWVSAGCSFGVSLSVALCRAGLGVPGSGTMGCNCIPIVNGAIKGVLRQTEWKSEERGAVARARLRPFVGRATT